MKFNLKKLFPVALATVLFGVLLSVAALNPYNEYSAVSEDMATNSFNVATTSPGFEVWVTNGTRRATLTAIVYVAGGNETEGIVTLTTELPPYEESALTYQATASTSDSGICHVRIPFSISLSPNERFKITNDQNPEAANAIVAYRLSEW